MHNKLLNWLSAGFKCGTNYEMACSRCVMSCRSNLAGASGPSGSKVDNVTRGSQTTETQHRPKREKFDGKPVMHAVHAPSLEQTVKSNANEVIEKHTIGTPSVAITLTFLPLGVPRCLCLHPNGLLELPNEMCERTPTNLHEVEMDSCATLFCLISKKSDEREREEWLSTPRSFKSGEGPITLVGIPVPSELWLRLQD